MASVSDNSLDTTTQAILDGMKAYLLGDRGREAEVNTAQVPNPAGSKSKRVTPRQGSPAPSNASTEAVTVVSHLLVVPSGFKTR